MLLEKKNMQSERRMVELVAEVKTAVATQTNTQAEQTALLTTLTEINASQESLGRKVSQTLELVQKNLQKMGSQVDGLVESDSRRASRDQPTATTQVEETMAGGVSPSRQECLEVVLPTSKEEKVGRLNILFAGRERGEQVGVYSSHRR